MTKEDVMNRWQLKDKPAEQRTMVELYLIPDDEAALLRTFEISDCQTVDELVTAALDLFDLIYTMREDRHQILMRHDPKQKQFEVSIRLDTGETTGEEDLDEEQRPPNCCFSLSVRHIRKLDAFIKQKLAASRPAALRFAFAYFVFVLAQLEEGYRLVVETTTHREIVYLTVPGWFTP